MASDVDFISMSRNGQLMGFCHALPISEIFYLKAMRTCLCDPKTKYSCAVFRTHVAACWNSNISVLSGPNSPEDRCKNCGIYGKSTKFGTKIENYLLKDISYGPSWDLSHNCNYNGLLHYTNIEARLGELFNYFQQIETMYPEKLTCLTKTE